MKVYNGDGIILGRLASAVAKDALLGEEVRIVNTEKVIISGKREVVFAYEKQRFNRMGHPLKSERHNRTPHRLVRRSVRGMLPWKFTRGKEAYRRVRCYHGIPSEFKSENLIVLDKESTKKLPTLRYVTVGQVCKNVGGKSI